MKIPPDREADILARAGEGWTQQRIASWLAAEHGIQVSQQAVAKLLARLAADQGDTARAVVRERVSRQLLPSLDRLEAQMPRLERLATLLFNRAEKKPTRATAKPFLETVDRIGVESVWTVEHPIVAENYEKLYSYSEDGQAPFQPNTVMPDPLEWLGFAAGCTTNVKLGTGVLLLPLHSPIIIAKRVATLDALSGGRVLLGIGIGWQKEEFAAVHVPYNERGRRIDEGIAQQTLLVDGGKVHAARQCRRAVAIAAQHIGEVAKQQWQQTIELAGQREQPFALLERCQLAQGIEHLFVETRHHGAILFGQLLLPRIEVLDRVQCKRKAQDVLSHSPRQSREESGKTV